MADSGSTDFQQGDALFSLTRKILSRLNQGITTSGGGGGGGGGAVTMADGANVTQGAKADAANTDSTSPWSVISLLKGIWAKLNGGVAVTSAGLTNLDVALSTRLKPADTLAAVTSITNPVAVTSAGLTNLDVALSTRLKPADTLAAVTTVSTVSTLTSGNVGGFTTVIQAHPTISTSAYSAGFTVGGILTLANAFRVSGGTGVLESIHIIDRSNQKAPFDILFFQVSPAAATTTDHAAFVFSTDDLNLIGHVSVAAADYVTINSKAVAHETSLGIALKNTVPSASLFAVVVTSGTPTYVAATDLQFTFGILQD